MTAHIIERAGEQLLLHPERALYWPAQRMLMVADVHFGKGAVFRRAGIPVPSGDTLEDLRRLDTLIDHFSPERLLVLGDLIHGHATSRSEWVAHVRGWRDAHAAVSVELVAGNHDRHFDCRTLGITVHDDNLRVGPLLLAHHPHTDGQGYVLAGHVHPGVVLRDGWRRHRLPAFCFDATTGLLPAFGTWTGLHEMAPAQGRELIAVTPAGLVPVPATRAD
ncbi:DNA ligase-associated metallophosphoesterase [Luteibacter sp. Sphag1AF]|uniref:ligase-associated DNA damage response endonuclease PdeM n=1 Tax=Luteibacter sp. Sphag1AF TaxID=2587031 RepID=UPI001618B7C7|nr:ligase-associated DNA damage response endonuclease PdeM [Luteibacter sp. Sphag1AF]MBB3228438.1 DNA ligase-associated metallophosphoesterase [Luteibacter sp. Sphag1AF]